MVKVEKKFPDSGLMIGGGGVLQSQKVSDDLLQKISSKNRRALDLIAAKCYYYHARVYEFLNQFDTIRR